MTPELELLFETQITNVSRNMSSIYSREDVVIILKTLRQSIDELPKVVAPTFTKEQVVASIKDMLENYDFDQYLDYEPELQGSYGGSYSLEINAKFDEDQFTRDFLCELPDYFETDKEEL